MRPAASSLLLVGNAPVRPAEGLGLPSRHPTHQALITALVKRYAAHTIIVSGGFEMCRAFARRYASHSPPFPSSIPLRRLH